MKANSNSGTCRQALLGGLFCAGCLLLLAGCAGREAMRTPAEIEPLCLAELDKATAVRAAEDVLARMHFEIDKTDLEAGLVRTRPLSGAQFFELWRRDNAGAFNSAEANLHSIRRTVTVQLEEKGRNLCIGCEVRTERLNLPEYEVSSSSRAYEMFSQSSSRLQKIRLNPRQEQGLAWVDLGKDRRLAAKILERIEGRIRQIREEDRT